MWCKNVLLQDKPGCYLDNAGINFEGSCEAELNDFVENSPFCPELIKEELMKSQAASIFNEVSEKLDEDPFIAGDDLYLRPEKVPVNIPRDETMQVYAGEFGETTNIDPNPEGDDNDRETFDDVISDLNVDWDEDYRLLNFDKDEILRLKT